MFPLKRIKYNLKKKFVFSDRYFFDFYFNNILFNQEKSSLKKNWRFYLKITPKFDFLIQLDASNKTILNRKREMEKNGLNLYRETIFKIFLERQNLYFLYLNTESTINQNTYILEHSLKCANILDN
ncbi:hypothetical protein [Aliarcobacter lanthieri]|uniref:hypothetical protein n=1 Tax=Aliarcobacter lanthieri TaxID=1355374 RepID=UPI00047E917E|nr:hypothetical protein [Aliarcobacter lanthieri]